MSMAMITIVDEIMAMLMARAEDGQIEIADAGVKSFIRDALERQLSPFINGVALRLLSPVSCASELTRHMVAVLDCLPLPYDWNADPLFLTLLEGTLSRLRPPLRNSQAWEELRTDGGLPESHAAHRDARLAAMVQEMRAVALAAGQCSMEGPQDVKSLMAAAEAERCAKWADQLADLLRHKDAT